MKGFGRLMCILALGSFLLHFFDMEFILLSWVDNWGTGTGNIIRVAMIVIGGAMWTVGHRQEQAAGG